MRKYLRPIGKTQPFRRFLHLFPTETHELAVVNNSGLFFTLASLRKHGVSAHPRLNVVIPDFWLDKTHSDYDELDWGQTPLGLPWYIRNDFTSLYKNHSRHDYIRWGQYKQLRAFAIEELKSLGVCVSTGTPRLTHEDGKYKVFTKERTFSIPSLVSHIYNSFRVPNVNHGLEELQGDVFHRSHTEIYQQPREKVEQGCYVVVGTNRSAIWVANHFPNTPFACIGFKHPQKALFSDETLPKNLIYYPKDRNLRDYTIEKSYTREGLVIISVKNHSSDLIDFAGDFFCSIGLVHSPEITHAVHPNSLTLYPVDDDNLQNIGTWINPEEQPIGGLAEATSRWAYATNNLHWAHEVYCYHTGTTIDYIATRFEQEGIILSYDFFDELNALIRNEIKVPAVQKIIYLYQSAYKKVCPNVTENKLNEIKELLEKIDDERTQVHLNDSDDTLVGSASNFTC